MKKQMIRFIFLFFICVLMPLRVIAEVDFAAITYSPWPINPGGSKTFTLRTLDENGNPVQGATVTFSVEPDDGTASLSTTSATTDDKGIARTTLTLGDNASGTYVVKVTFDSGRSLTGTATVETPRVSSGLSISLITRSAQNNPGESVQFIFEVREDGRLASDKTVTFSVEPDDGTASLSTTSTTTDSYGKARTMLIPEGGASGAYTVTATLSSGQSASGTATVESAPTPPELSISVISGPGIGEPGGNLTFVVEVRADDSPASGETVTFSVSPSDGNVSLSASSATTTGNGQAQTTLTLGSNASGAYTITATLSNGQSASGTATVESPPVGQQQQEDQQPPETGETTPPSIDETALAVEREETPAPEDTTPESVDPGSISFSELMFATNGGLFSLPQWIELYNNAAMGTQPVNLKGWQLAIEARDSETRHRYSVIELGELHIPANQTVLLVTRDGRSSSHLSEGQVYNLHLYHSELFNLDLRENPILPASGFLLKLLAPDGTLVDTAGNLDGNKRSMDAPAWKLPSGWTEDDARTSLIRQYEDSIALTGTSLMSWVRAVDMELSMDMYYGHKTDIGTPGGKNGGIVPVMLSHFKANMTATGVVVEWKTASETNNAGFNILRGQTKEGSFVKVNPTLILGAGTTAEYNTYTWTDKTAKPNVSYYYRIEDVSFSGNRRRLATVHMRGYVSAEGKLITTWGGLKGQR